MCVTIAKFKCFLDAATTDFYFILFICCSVRFSFEWLLIQCSHGLTHKMYSSENGVELIESFSHIYSLNLVIVIPNVDIKLLVRISSKNSSITNFLFT